MTAQVINVCLVAVTILLGIYNLKSLFQGTGGVGKIYRTLGPFGYLALVLIANYMEISGWAFRGNKFLDKAGITLNFIIAVDNFFNGNDPPKQRRRAWLKSKFAKLAPVRSS